MTAGNGREARNTQNCITIREAQTASLEEDKYGQKRRIPRSIDARKHEQSDEAGTENAASDGRETKGA